MIKETIEIGLKTAVVTRYSQSHLNRRESVLEHTGFVCFICAIIGLKHPDVDLGKLLTKATLHDIEESYIGDIANPVKYDNPDILSEVEKIGEKAMVQIEGLIGVGSLYSIWRNSKDSTLEGRIVKIADVISVVAKVYEEVVLYKNSSIKCFALNTLNFFETQQRIEKDPYLLDVINEVIEIHEIILEDKL